MSSLLPIALSCCVAAARSLTGRSPTSRRKRLKASSPVRWTRSEPPPGHERWSLQLTGFSIREPAFRSHHSVAQRPAELRDRYLEHVVRPRSHALGNAQSCSAEEMDVYIARPAKQVIFEVMVFQIGNGMRHIGLAAHEWLFP